MLSNSVHLILWNIIGFFPIFVTMWGNLAPELGTGVSERNIPSSSPVPWAVRPFKETTLHENSRKPYINA
jgi:hypothetical protein